MEHFYCEACGGVADHPKVCDTEGCTKKGESLTPCSCVDPSSHEKELPSGHDEETKNSG